MEEITLQLRQAESNDVQQNGVYSTTLAHPIELRPGDEVSVKSVFLDTTDVISVPTEGLDVSLTGCKYLVNYNINQQFAYRTGTNSLSAYGTVPDGTGPTPTTGDNELYWLADAMASTAHTPYFIQNCNVFPATKGRGGKRYGGVDVPIEFTNPAFPDKPFAGKGTLHIASYQEDRFEKHNPIPIPSQDREANPSAFVTFTCASVGGVKQIRVDPLFSLVPFNIDRIEFVNPREYPNQPIQPDQNTYQISPQYFTWNATIPGGDYTPTEIAALLNDKLTPVELLGPTSTNYSIESGTDTWDGANTKFPTQSPFLETILQNRQRLITQAAADGNTHEQCLINASRKNLTNPSVLADNAGAIPRKFFLDAMVADFKTTPFTPPVDRYIGTNQISMSFDENERKLKFDTLHFPIYVNSTSPEAAPTTFNNDAVPGIQYNELPFVDGETNVNAPSGMAKAYSGIAFTAMSPPSFWSQQLGFENNTISVAQNVVSCDFPSDAFAVPNSFQIDNAIPGRTITEAAATLSVPVVTSSAPQYTGGPNGIFARPLFSSGTAGSGASVSTPDTVAVFASKTYNDSIQDAGYFLVDVSHNFNTDFVAGKIERPLTQGAGTTGHDTLSVVSRYYTANNFVTDQGAGSIVYTHSGAKQNLTDLAIRIKNPDGSFISESTLGDKNSVFISIKRAKQIVDVDAPEKAK